MRCDFVTITDYATTNKLMCGLTPKQWRFLNMIKCKLSRRWNTDMLEFLKHI